MSFGFEQWRHFFSDDTNGGQTSRRWIRMVTHIDGKQSLEISLYRSSSGRIISIICLVKDIGVGWIIEQKLDCKSPTLDAKQKLQNPT
jgi:hypothetical protein